MTPKGRDFDFLPEILMLLYAAGLDIREVPFHYQPRREGRSRVKLLRFGWAYLNTLGRMWQLRKAEATTVAPEPSSAQLEERKLNSLREGSEVP